jgi:hypothetical protein
MGLPALIQRNPADCAGSMPLSTRRLGFPRRNSMLSIEDCIGLCGLTAAEVKAIAEHEHLPDITAATLGSYLLHQQHGGARIRQMLVDDIRASLAAGNATHAARLMGALRHFLALHPDALEEAAAGSARSHD